MSVVVSLVLAHSSTKTCEKWPGSNTLFSRALDIHPAVKRVHITILYPYKYFKDGN